MIVYHLSKPESLGAPILTNAFEGSNLSLVREYERHALESISDVLSVDLKTSDDSCAM